jgi:ABC-type amino acid transport system permease subunit
MASVIAASNEAPVKYMTQTAAIKKCPIVYITVLRSVPLLLRIFVKRFSEVIIISLLFE